MIIDGRKIASDILERLKASPKPTKYLAAVLVGESAASESFLRQKEKIARGLGIDFQLRRFPEDILKDALCVAVTKMVHDPECGGVILQLPLPDRTMETDVLDLITTGKDIDVLGARALDAFRIGEGDAIPPAVGTVIAVLDACFSNPVAVFQALITSTVAVVGAGRLVGQPIAGWLNGKARQVIVLDKADDLGRIKNADLVVCGVGVPGLIAPAMLKDGAIVIDFGYGMRDGKVMGDFDPAGMETEKVKCTPTPGGTGPILVAKLFENFYKLNNL
jgi:methylenetetrahydrofolate dehydrogenase (NADP+)/methenyltetrahydrofolate cyclohydrolase